MIRRALALFTGCFLLSGSSLLAQIPERYTNPSKFAAPDTSQLEDQKEPELIEPWIYNTQSGFTQIADDSLLRWQIWPNWGEKLSYRHDVISFRQGSNGRIDAYQISGYSPYEQQLFVDGIDMSNPVTGLINYNFVPTSKVGYQSEQFGDVYTSNIRLKSYYLTEPLSYLNFDEAKYNFRNLEFMVAQNFSERTQAEISFWDRRDGGNYPQNEVVGSQIVFKGYHYLNQKLQVRTTLIRSAYDREESFGYVMDDLQTFGFGEFTSTANQRTASADVLRRDFIIGIYSRDDSLSNEKAGVSFSQTKNSFDLPFSSDTLYWDMTGYALKGFSWWEGNRWQAKAQVDLGYHKAKSTRNFTETSWLMNKGQADLTYHLTKSLSTFLVGKASQRNTGHQGLSGTIGWNFEPSTRTHLEASVSLASVMPSIQQLYWSSRAFYGNPNLENRQSTSFYGALSQQWGKFRFGVSGRYQLLSNDFFVGTDSSFVNSNAYEVVSTTVFGKFKNRRWEVESSATTQALTSTEPTSVFELNNVHDPKIWFRNNIFIRGYVFDRAAYLRAGIRTTVAPVPYRSAYFNTALQYWENSTTDVAEIPSWFRMDAELSARLRGMMVLLRWENTLDGIGQLGYFETATFPMPGRRLIVGIRAQFRN